MLPREHSRLLGSVKNFSPSYCNQSCLCVCLWTKLGIGWSAAADTAASIISSLLHCWHSFADSNTSFISLSSEISQNCCLNRYIFLLLYYYYKCQDYSDTIAKKCCRGTVQNVMSKFSVNTVQQISLCKIFILLFTRALSEQGNDRERSWSWWEWSRVLLQDCSLTKVIPSLSWHYSTTRWSVEASCLTWPWDWSDATALGGYAIMMLMQLDAAWYKTIVNCEIAMGKHSCHMFTDLHTYWSSLA